LRQQFLNPVATPRLVLDHVNRKTQYENPVIQAKRELDMSKRMEAAAANFLADSVDSPMEPKSFFTKNPSDLLGERIQTTLIKSQRGLGFTIVGGDCSDDENIEEFLQIKSIVPNSPASADGKLRTGDILVFVNHICVLGFTHHEMVNIFQSIRAGDEVHLDVCRGYKLPFDPTDPNTEIVTTIAVNGITDDVEKNQLFLDLSHDGYNFLDLSNDPDGMNYGKNQPGPSAIKNSNFEIPEIHDIIIVKGDQGFGFTIAESNIYGQKVKKILDRQCCKNLQEGDILLSINNINIKNLTHNDVVQVLKECPKNTETVLRVQRGLIRSSLNKFNGKTRGKNDLKLTANMTNGKPFMNGMFRSKTPTADLYSTQIKEQLPIRPKTPLVDTRARIQMKTPIQMNDLNTDDIELDSKLTDHDDNKSTISTATTAYDTTKLLTEQFDNFVINDQRSDTYTTTDSITSKTSGGGRNRFFSPLDIKNGNGMDNVYNNGGDYYYGNSSNSVYSLPPPPPSIPTSQTRYIQPIQQPQQSASTIPYAHQPHDSCFCYDCQDYRIKQAQQGEYHVTPSNNNSDYSTLQSHFNMPPQMSDNVGKRINDYLMDRKRNAGEFYNNGNNNFNTFRPNGNGHINLNGMVSRL
jgi:atrophin-1 interacting protein 3 (BAI1-associated protein 1)